MTKATQIDPRAAPGLMDGQAPIAAVGVVAIAVIVAVNYFARPSMPAGNRANNAADCKQCGTIVAIRRSAHSVPVTLVEVQMSDGTVRTLRSPGQQFSVGDNVEIKDQGLTLRPGS